MKIIITDYHTNQGVVSAYDDEGHSLSVTVSAIDGDPGTFEIKVREFDPVADIREFHEKFGLSYSGKPRVLPEGIGELRIARLKEEPKEYEDHVAPAYDETTRPPPMRDAANYAFHLEGLLDALVDTVYIAMGNSYLHGFNFREAWRRVHAANMAKVRAVRAEDSKHGSVFDIVKPDGWEPPSHIDLVEDNDLMEPHGLRS